MRAKIKLLTSNPLFASSLVMVLGSNLFNLGQFIYHFIAGRLLGKAYYGDLAAIISVLGLISIIQLSIGLTIVKFIASTKDNQEISNFARWFNWWAILSGGILAVASLVLAPFIIKFLNITQSESVYLLAPMIFFTVILFTQRSILHGLIFFGRFVISLLTEVVVKIILTVALIFSGFAVFGAMGGIVLGAVVSFFITRFFLLNYISGKRGRMPEVTPLLKYSLPVFLQGLALTSMYSTDFILVKHFFPKDEAGIYASLAVLGRVAFFASSPITHVMFPIVAKNHAAGKPYLKIFYLSILLVCIIAITVILFYVFLPEFVVGLLFGQEFIEGASLLWWFGLFMSILVLDTLFTQFYLSIGKLKIIWLFVAAAILQAVLIWFIHPNILTVIQISILAAALLALGLIVYFPYHNSNGKKASFNHSTSLSARKNHKTRFREYQQDTL